MAQEDRYAQEQEDFLRRLRARNGRRPEQPESQQESVRPELQPPPQDGLNLLIASQNREAPSPSVEGGAPPPDPEGRNVLGSAALETVLPAAAYWGGAALGGPFAPITGPIAGGVAGYLSSLKAQKMRGVEDPSKWQALGAGAWSALPPPIARGVKGLKGVSGQLAVKGAGQGGLGITMEEGGRRFEEGKRGSEILPPWQTVVPAMGVGALLGGAVPMALWKRRGPRYKQKLRQQETRPRGSIDPQTGGRTGPTQRTWGEEELIRMRARRQHRGSPWKPGAFEVDPVTGEMVPQPGATREPRWAGRDRYLQKLALRREAEQKKYASLSPPPDPLDRKAAPDTSPDQPLPEESAVGIQLTGMQRQVEKAIENIEVPPPHEELSDLQDFFPTVRAFVAAHTSDIDEKSLQYKPLGLYAADAAGEPYRWRVNQREVFNDALRAGRLPTSVEVYKKIHAHLNAIKNAKLALEAPAKFQQRRPANASRGPYKNSEIDTQKKFFEDEFKERVRQLKTVILRRLEEDTSPDAKARLERFIGKTSTSMFPRPRWAGKRPDKRWSDDKKEKIGSLEIQVEGSLLAYIKTMGFNPNRFMGKEGSNKLFDHILDPKSAFETWDAYITRTAAKLDPLVDPSQDLGLSPLMEQIQKFKDAAAVSGLRPTGERAAREPGKQKGRPPGTGKEEAKWGFHKEHNAGQKLRTLQANDPDAEWEMSDVTEQVITNNPDLAARAANKRLLETAQRQQKTPGVRYYQFLTKEGRFAIDSARVKEGLHRKAYEESVLNQVLEWQAGQRQAAQTAQTPQTPDLPRIDLGLGEEPGKPPQTPPADEPIIKLGGTPPDTSSGDKYIPTGVRPRAEQTTAEGRGTAIEAGFKDISTRLNAIPDLFKTRLYETTPGGEGRKKTLNRNLKVAGNKKKQGAARWKAIRELREEVEWIQAEREPKRIKAAWDAVDAGVPYVPGQSLSPGEHAQILRKKEGPPAADPLSTSEHTPPDIGTVPTEPVGHQRLQDLDLRETKGKIAMNAVHADKVLKGEKTQTIRTRKYSNRFYKGPGVYTLAKGRRAKITLKEQGVKFSKIKAKGLGEEFARKEGYDSLQAFRNAMEKDRELFSPIIKWLDGDPKAGPMDLYDLEPLETSSRQPDLSSPPSEAGRSEELPIIGFAPPPDSPPPPEIFLDEPGRRALKDRTATKGPSGRPSGVTKFWIANKQSRNNAKLRANTLNTRYKLKGEDRLHPISLPVNGLVRPGEKDPRGFHLLFGVKGTGQAVGLTDPVTFPKKSKGIFLIVSEKELKFNGFNGWSDFHIKEFNEGEHSDTWILKASLPPISSVIPKTGRQGGSPVSQRVLAQVDEAGFPLPDSEYVPGRASSSYTPLEGYKGWEWIPQQKPSGTHEADWVFVQSTGREITEAFGNKLAELFKSWGINDPRQFVWLQKGRTRLVRDRAPIPVEAEDIRKIPSPDMTTNWVRDKDGALRYREQVGHVPQRAWGVHIRRHEKFGADQWDAIRSLAASRDSPVLDSHLWLDPRRIYRKGVVVGEEVKWPQYDPYDIHAKLVPIPKRHKEWSRAKMKEALSRLQLERRKYEEVELLSGETPADFVTHQDRDTQGLPRTKEQVDDEITQIQAMLGDTQKGIGGQFKDWGGGRTILRSQLEQIDLRGKPGAEDRRQRLLAKLEEADVEDIREDVAALVGRPIRTVDLKSLPFPSGPIIEARSSSSASSLPGRKRRQIIKFRPEEYDKSGKRKVPPALPELRVWTQEYGTGSPAELARARSEKLTTSDEDITTLNGWIAELADEPEALKILKAKKASLEKKKLTPTTNYPGVRTEINEAFDPEVWAGQPRDVEARIKDLYDLPGLIPQERRVINQLARRALLKAGRDYAAETAEVKITEETVEKVLKRLPLVDPNTLGMLGGNINWSVLGKVLDRFRPEGGYVEGATRRILGPRSPSKAYRVNGLTRDSGWGDLEDAADLQEAALVSDLKSRGEQTKSVLPKSKLHPLDKPFKKMWLKLVDLDATFVKAVSKAIEEGIVVDAVNNPATIIRIVKGGISENRTDEAIRNMMAAQQHIAQAGLTKPYQQFMMLSTNMRAVATVKQHRATARATYKTAQDVRGKAFLEGASRKDIRLLERKEHAAKNRMIRAESEWKKIQSGDALMGGYGPERSAEALQVLRKSQTPEAWQRIVDSADVHAKAHDVAMEWYLKEGLVTKELVDQYRERGDYHTPFMRIASKAQAIYKARNSVFRKQGLIGTRVSQLMDNYYAAKTPLAKHHILGSAIGLGNMNREIHQNQLARVTVDFFAQAPDTKHLVKKLESGEVVKEGLSKVPVWRDGRMELWSLPTDLAKVVAHPSLLQLEASGLGPLNIFRMAKGMVSRSATSWNPAFILANLQRDIVAARTFLPEVFRTDPSAETIPDILRTYAEYFKSAGDILRHRGRQNPRSGGYGLLRGMGKLFPKGSSRDLDEFYRSGASLSTYSINQSPASYIGEKHLQHILGNTGGMGLLNPRRFTAPSFVLNELSSVFEVSTKLMTWRRLRNAGYEETEAAFLTRRFGGSPDFAFGGEWKEFMDLTFMFYNPATQGGVQILEAGQRLLKMPARLPTTPTAKMRRGASDAFTELTGKKRGKSGLVAHEVKRLATGRLAAVTGMTAAGMVALQMWNRQDQFRDDKGEPYLERITPAIRDRYHVFFIPSGPMIDTPSGRMPSYFLKPKPYHSTVAYGWLEKALAYHVGDERTEYTDLAEGALESIGHLSPVGGGGWDRYGSLPANIANAVGGQLNPLAGVTIDILSNRRSPSGIPLIPRRMEGITDTKEIDSPRVDPASRAIATRLGVAPIHAGYITERLLGPALYGTLQAATRPLGTPSDQSWKQQDFSELDMIARVFGPLGQALTRQFGPVGRLDARHQALRNKFYYLRERADGTQLNYDNALEQSWDPDRGQQARNMREAVEGLMESAGSAEGPGMDEVFDKWTEPLNTFQTMRGMWMTELLKTDDEEKRSQLRVRIGRLNRSEHLLLTAYDSILSRMDVAHRRRLNRRAERLGAERRGNPQEKIEVIESLETTGLPPMPRREVNPTARSG